MIRLAPALALIVLVSTPVHARQAFSVSLTECAVIYDEFRQSPKALRSQSPEKLERIATVAKAYQARAFRQAAKEAHSDPAQHIARTRARLEKKWRKQVRNPLKLRDTLDWIDYCRAFGKKLKLPLVY